MEPLRKENNDSMLNNITIGVCSRSNNSDNILDYVINDKQAPAVPIVMRKYLLYQRLKSV